MNDNQRFYYKCMLALMVIGPPPIDPNSWTREWRVKIRSFIDEYLHDEQYYFESSYRGFWATVREYMKDRDDPTIVVAALNFDVDTDDPLSSSPFDPALYSCCILELGKPASPHAEDNLVERVEWCEKLYDWVDERIGIDQFVEFSRCMDRWWSLQEEANK